MNITFGNDGLCTCSCADICPLGKTGMAPRCNKMELAHIMPITITAAEFAAIPLPAPDFNAINQRTEDRSRTRAATRPAPKFYAKFLEL